MGYLPCMLWLYSPTDNINAIHVPDRKGRTASTHSLLVSLLQTIAQWEVATGLCLREIQASTTHPVIALQWMNVRPHPVWIRDLEFTLQWGTV